MVFLETGPLLRAPGDDLERRRTTGAGGNGGRGPCRVERGRLQAAALLKRARQVELRSIERGKYFRLVSTVVVDGQDLAEALIEARYGRTYNGGKRLGWCDE